MSNEVRQTEDKYRYPLPLKVKSVFGNSILSVHVKITFQKENN